MSLQALLKESRFTGLSDAEAAELLNTPSVEKRRTSDVGYRGIVKNHGGTTFATTILGKLEAAGAVNPLLKATYFAMCGDGIDFSSDETQEQLTALQQAGVFTNEEATQLKAIGRWLVSEASEDGLGTVTEQQVAAARAQNTREARLQDWDSRKAHMMNEIVNPGLAANNDDATIAAAVIAWLEGI